MLANIELLCGKIAPCRRSRIALKHPFTLDLSRETLQVLFPISSGFSRFLRSHGRQDILGIIRRFDAQVSEDPDNERYTVIACLKILVRVR